MSSGKYYAEFLAGDSNIRGCAGVCEATYAFSGTDRAYTGSVNNVVMRDYDGQIYANGANVSSNTATITHNSTVIGVALDLDSATKTVKWYLDGTLHYTYTLSSPPSMRFSAGDISSNYTAIVKANFGQDHTFAGTKTALATPYTDANGLGEFYYDPPAGFTGLYTPVTTTRPTRRWGGMTGRTLVESTAGTPAFKALAFTGNGAPSRSITGVGFQPDFVWLKNRDKTLSHQIVDVLRGANKALLTNSQNPENNTQTDFSGGGVETIDADGFTLGDGTVNNSNFNGTSDDSIAWCLKAGGAPTATNSGGQTPTSGSVMIDGAASTAQLPTASIYPRKLSANTAAGFSIVQWSGTENTNGETVPHGLNSAPELIIFKSLISTSNWIVGTDYLSNTSGWNKQLYLNLSDGESVNTDASFNNTAPSATVFSLKNSDATNKSGTDSMIAYCWHSVPGFSKVGSYTGDGTTSNDVNLGFRPAFVMVKATNSARSWAIFDNARDVDNQTTTALRADMNNGDLTGVNLGVDFSDEGFTLTGPDSLINNTYNYIYMAFAEEIPGADTIPTTGVLGLAEDYQSKL
jgi:hypothetical protein